MFGFGSRSSKKKGKGTEQHVVRQSPSLPSMSTQGVAWPSTLVDIASIRQSPPQTPAHGAAKVSFSAPEGGVAIPFHRPFRGSISSKRGNEHGNGAERGTIASLYMARDANPPPSAFGTKPGDRAGTPHSTRTRHSHSQRKKSAPIFNMMVAGAQGTGKVCPEIITKSNLLKAHILGDRVPFFDLLLTQQTSPLLHQPSSVHQWTTSSEIAARERSALIWLVWRFASPGLTASCYL